MELTGGLPRLGRTLSGMSIIATMQLTAVATAVLAAFAIVTALFAFLAFREQSKELGVLQRQANHQADMLRIQSDQLDAQHIQFQEQRKVNEKQTGVLELQARELEASLAQRQDDAESQRRVQANRVAAWFGDRPGGIVVAEGPLEWGALIRNDSALPIFDLGVLFYYVDEVQPGGEWQLALRGGPVERIRVIPPQADRFVEIPEDVRGKIPAGGVNEQACVVSIEFTDAAGNRWGRDPRGTLASRG